MRSLPEEAEVGSSSTFCVASLKISDRYNSGPARARFAFSRRTAFAWAWIPGRYLRGTHAPLVLTLSLRRRDSSPRWKEIVEPTPGRFTHHLELHAATDIDAEVRTWLLEAWQGAA